MYILYLIFKEIFLLFGFIFYDISVLNLVVDNDFLGCVSFGLEEEFFKVEEVFGRRFLNDGFCYEYKVWFKGYGLEDDMWFFAFFFKIYLI